MIPSNRASTATPAPIPAFAAVLMEELPKLIGTPEFVAEAEADAVVGPEVDASTTVVAAVVVVDDDDEDI